jgi:hypothetical protein
MNKIRYEASKWAADWPHHCRACRGWGGKVIAGRFWGPPEACYPSEFIPCEDRGPQHCHRCHGSLEVHRFGGSIAYGACTECGWDFNDGQPPHCDEVPEEETW